MLQIHIKYSFFVIIKCSVFAIIYINLFTVIQFLLPQKSLALCYLIYCKYDSKEVERNLGKQEHWI